MKILVTGAKGFIGANLAQEINNRQAGEILPFDVDDDPGLLAAYACECGFVFHLAGVNRPEREEDFMQGNAGLTARLTEALKNNPAPPPVAFASSAQAALDNPYGRSKKAAEDWVFRYGRETGARVMVYRLPNVFGKWCRPNYNSAVATFCHNIARGLPVRVDSRDTALRLAYIDDVVCELIEALYGRERRDGDYCAVPAVYTATLGAIADALLSFKNSRSDLSVPDMGDDFTRKLYGTYMSYLPPDGFGYALSMKTDARGSFTEFIRTPDRGQFSVNVMKPGVTKGQHWHHGKTEKFLVVSGRGRVLFRKVGGAQIIECPVSGDRFQAVDVPPGYAHAIVNDGETDLVALVWASEPFDPDRPDTYRLDVRPANKEASAIG